ncbi:hypothetical protein PENCOP_c001G05380 [Penicillium coprophilum]|uniref:Beta-lactamase-related domain-containing protein n=1 Tax=Penicillium coprophilum TaxID=36646 RepID=A0A1V6V8B2_9EURO|nr:hypothetical protein PENCOP_c001G05380 [Penicillium coprophilum]
MNPARDSRQTPLGGDFDENVSKTMDYWKIPGIAVAVVDGDTTWKKVDIFPQTKDSKLTKCKKKGYGIADQASSTKVESNTLFYGGSTTKAFTAAIMSMLVQDNAKYPKVQWNTPVSELIREDFVLDDKWTTANMTIEDILSHRTGMPGHDLSLGSVHPGNQATVQDVVRSLRFLPSNAPPRTTYQYNNSMYIVASHIIQRVMDDDLGAVLEREIWRPLKMSSTYFRLADVLEKDKPLAKGYAFTNGKYEEVPWKNKPEISGAGAIISSVEDYAKWVHALLNQTGTNLSSESWKAIWTARTLIPNSEPFLAPMAYALAWNRYVYHGVEIITHDGGIDGFGAEIVMIPSLKYGVVTMANSTYSSNFGGTCLAYDLIDSKLDIATEARFGWKEHYVKVLQQMEEFNKKAVEHFYPNLPSPPLPGPTFPLEAYTGTYWHDAYGQLALFLDTDKKLHANRTSPTTACSLTFEHVIGDYFIATMHVVGAETVIPAEFSPGPEGKPRSVGIGWEPRLGNNKIWMRKVDDGVEPVLTSLQGAQPLSYQAYQAPQLPEFLASQIFM